ncbi:uncharacterized protein LOC134177141 isoform X2 [Corticium candelabrum]|uniref:uncharacterized protein LOC134177141 isoform X2 n=1 Tax=Corticium candelabrum TaxID=121492 RepID=UPI002E2678B9|nr:uncharacterized protein LOC134177141 isoform X2 [Corticium candelabrum]
MYGLSGPSGRHCCLWCLIDSSQMAKPAAERTPSQQRSLDQLITDFRKFTESGSNMKRAKFYNNVIRPHLLAVPIDHVAIPALHISLGVFAKLYDQLERAAHKIDNQRVIEESERAPTHMGHATASSFKQHISSIREAQKLKEEARNNKLEAPRLFEIANWINLTGSTNTESTPPAVIQIYDQAKQLAAQADQLEDQEKALRLESFPLHDGSSVCALVKTLPDIGIEKQAYHGGSFIGNHIHKCCQGDNIEKLCNSIATAMPQDLTARNKGNSRKHCSSICSNIQTICSLP